MAKSARLIRCAAVTVSAVLAAVFLWPASEVNEPGQVGAKAGVRPRPLVASSWSFDAPFDRPEVAELVIENRSGSTIDGLWLWNAAAPNFYDVRTIASAAVHGARADEEKALRIWRFVQDNSYHFLPATLGLELHDPAILFAAYGFGMCDDRASALVSLAQAAGLPARVAGFGAKLPHRDRPVAHTVAEVFCDGRWVMLDADEGTAIRRDGKLLSLAEAQQAILDGSAQFEGKMWPSDYTAALAKAEHLAKATDAAAQLPAEPPTGRTMGMTLRAGETVTFDFNARGSFHAMVEPSPWEDGNKEPPVYANGRIVHAPETDEGPGSSLIYRLRFPFPLVNGHCTFGLSGPTPSAEVYVTTHARAQQFASAGKLRDSDRWWRRLAKVVGAGKHKVNMEPFFRTTTEMPTRHDYLLRFRLAEGSQLRSLRATTLFQFAPRNAFRVFPGANTIHCYGDDGLRVARARPGEVYAESPRVRVVLRYMNKDL